MLSFQVQTAFTFNMSSNVCVVAFFFLFAWRPSLHLYPNVNLPLTILVNSLLVIVAGLLSVLIHAGNQQHFGYPQCLSVRPIDPFPMLANKSIAIILWANFCFSCFVHRTIVFHRGDKGGTLRITMGVTKYEMMLQAGALMAPESPRLLKSCLFYFSVGGGFIYCKYVGAI